MDNIISEPIKEEKFQGDSLIGHVKVNRSAVSEVLLSFLRFYMFLFVLIVFYLFFNGF